MADSMAKAADPRSPHAAGDGERPSIPKPLVRLKTGRDGWEAEVREVADVDAEAVATGGGFQAIDLLEQHRRLRGVPEVDVSRGRAQSVVYTVARTTRSRATRTAAGAGRGGGALPRAPCRRVRGRRAGRRETGRRCPPTADEVRTCPDMCGVRTAMR